MIYMYNITPHSIAYLPLRKIMIQLMIVMISFLQFNRKGIER